MPPKILMLVKLSINTLAQKQGGIMRYYKNIKEFVKGKKVFCGIDIHMNSWNICFYCDGEVIEKTKLPVDYTKFHFLLLSYSMARELTIVYEAGFSGFWLYRRLSKDYEEKILSSEGMIYLASIHRMLRRLAT